MRELLKNIYMQRATLLFLPPLIALAGITLPASVAMMGLLPLGVLALALICTLLAAVPISVTFHFLVCLPMYAVFRKYQAHWILYAVTSYSIAILGLGIFLPPDAAFGLGLIGALQGGLTYYFGRQKPTHKD